MNHSESEMCVSILGNDHLHGTKGTPTAPSPSPSDKQKRLTVLNQRQDYSAVFGKAHDVITVMRDAYEEMFTNWKLESELNSELDKKVLEVSAALELQKKITKQLLNDKSRLQEEMERLERRPRLKSKVDTLDGEVRGLMREIRELREGVRTRDRQLEEKERVLTFYREEFGMEKEVARDQDTFRPRAKAIRRAESQQEDRKVHKHCASGKLLRSLITDTLGEIL